MPLAWDIRGIPRSHLILDCLCRGFQLAIFFFLLFVVFYFVNVHFIHVVRAPRCLHKCILRGSLSAGKSILRSLPCMLTLRPRKRYQELLPQTRVLDNRRLVYVLLQWLAQHLDLFRANCFQPHKYANAINDGLLAEPRQSSYCFRHHRLEGLSWITIRHGLLDIPEQVGSLQLYQVRQPLRSL
jgi:hypothetical protein